MAVRALLILVMLAFARPVAWTLAVTLALVAPGFSRR